MPSPVVYLHGLLGGPDLWVDAAPASARRHAFPGHGGRLGAGTASLDAFAADLAAQIETPSVLVGASMGASVALILAARFPQSVTRLVLTGATPCLAARPDFPHALAQARIDALTAGLERDFRGACRAFCTAMAGGDRLARDRLLQAALATDPDVAIVILRDSAQRDLRPLLAQVRVPVTVIAADDDAITPGDAQAALAGALAARLERFEDGGHAAYLTRPDRFAASLKRAWSD